MPRHTRAHPWIAVCLLLLALPAPRFSAAAAPTAAPPDVIYGLTSTNLLLHFSAATPAVISATVAISGLEAGANLVAIDFRPKTAELFGLAIKGSGPNAAGRLYLINPATGLSTPIGATPFYTSFNGSTAYGIDFNPVVDRIRVVNALRQNVRVNPVGGTLTALDPNLNGGVAYTPTLAAIAYDRNAPGGAATTLYGIDYVIGSLVRIGGIDGVPSSNGGLVTPVGSLGLGAPIIHIFMGLDISSRGQAYASVNAGSTYRLYTLNLNTGAAADVGAIFNGLTPIEDIAVLPRFSVYLPLARK